VSFLDHRYIVRSVSDREGAYARDTYKQPARREVRRRGKWRREESRDTRGGDESRRQEREEERVISALMWQMVRRRREIAILRSITDQITAKEEREIKMQDVHAMGYS
jgi:hypothetical protein